MKDLNETMTEKEIFIFIFNKLKVKTLDFGDFLTVPLTKDMIIDIHFRENGSFNYIGDSFRI